MPRNIMWNQGFMKLRRVHPTKTTKSAQLTSLWCNRHRYSVNKLQPFTPLVLGPQLGANVANSCAVASHIWLHPQNTFEIFNSFIAEPNAICPHQVVHWRVIFHCCSYNRPELRQRCFLDDTFERREVLYSWEIEIFSQVQLFRSHVIFARWRASPGFRGG